MSDAHKRVKIDEIRSRLYQRGVTPPKRTEAALTDEPRAVASEWSEPPQPVNTSAPETAETPEPTVAPVAATAPRTSKQRRRFRRAVLLTGLVFFFGALVVSTLLMFYGNNSISADNISVSVNGPFTIGGGETLTLQVGVTNANSVPISAATLIIEYPEGTRAVDTQEMLYNERIPLDTIRAGETVNVPVQAVVFGEENTNHQVAVSIEYRVDGSNATFYREAEPFAYKISSAPIVLQLDTVERLSSGQETELTVSVVSNSQNVVNDVVVTAEYPAGFDFTSSEPAPARGRNTWVFDSIQPGTTETITLQGVVTGSENEALALNFFVGAPDQNNPTALASVFNAVSTEFVIEQPFLAVDLVLDGQETNDIVVEPGRTVSGQLVVSNSLSDTLYDTTVQLTLGGNALSDPAVSQTDGFYDSLENTITWEPTSRDRLEEIEPGETVLLNFSLEPNEEITQTPTITLAAEVASRRVQERRVPEALRGNVEGTIRVASEPTLLTEARRTAGPVPPTVDETTDYTISILAETTSNNLNDTVVTAQLPQYVTFGEELSDIGSITYNQANRTVTWNIGSVTAGEPAVGSFRVSFRPSVSQIGTIPTLLETQRLRAEDAFTGSIVRADNDEISTELSTELGFERDNGRVIE